MKFDVIRMWKNELYRHSLSEEERSQLPGNPVGELEITDTDLRYIYGGLRPGDAPPLSYQADCSSQPPGGCMSAYGDRCNNF